jgi:D-amino peptidase
MKVLISADMEGTAGIVDRPHTAIPDRGTVQNNAAEYDWARRLMTEEVNAAVTGAFEGGATEVWVTDAHGSMRNLLPLALHRDARYVSGSPKALCMMEGLDETFGAVMFTGYHGKAGTPASVLAHTYIGLIQDVRINGTSVGEYGINAALAGHFRVPVVLVTGDNTVVEQARGLLGEDLIGVEVKRGLSTFAAVHMHPEKARDAIRAGAAEAVQRARASRVKPFQPKTPIRLDIDVVSPDMADLASLPPGVARTGPRSVAYEDQDMLRVFRAWRAMLNAMLSRTPL